jgi:hypothetical protein
LFSPSVPDHGHHVLVAAPHADRLGDADAGRDRRARVPRAEDVVLRLGAAQELPDPVRLPDAGKTIASSGQELVCVGLVADVPDQAIPRRVEDVVQGGRDLDRAQAGGQVSAGARDDLDDLGAQRVGHLGETIGR